MFYNQDNIIAKSIGQKIALERKLNHLSQKQLAEDICSQSMISSIEKGNYVPNAILLSRLCKRLNISMDNTVLSNYLRIDALDSFNTTIKNLCDKHDYLKMLKYLNDSSLLNSLYKNEDFQTYYYYYGVATYQYFHDTKSSLQYLQLAYNYTITPRKNILTPNELLILSNIAFIKIQTGDEINGFKSFKQALQIIKNKKFTSYDENMTLIFYQFGRCLLKANRYEQATEILILGIDWTTQHSSHYMLSDLFLLLSQAYSFINKQKDSQKAILKSELIEDIFHQDTYKF